MTKYEVVTQTKGSSISGFFFRTKTLQIKAEIEAETPEEALEKYFNQINKLEIKT